MSKQENSVNELFRKFSSKAATIVGSSWVFIASVITIIIWAATGPMFHYSDTWQLVINTGTSVITFLMVFLIQNTQNRDAKAIHLKLDELIKATEGARNHMIDLDQLSDEQLKRLEADYKRICAVDGDGRQAVTEELMERTMEKKGSQQ